MVKTFKKAGNRETWVDKIKVYACVLVVLGHFLQSMISANILGQNKFFDWFEQSIYMFHVQLFFICSGYLYQKYSKVDCFNKWIVNVKKKIVALGIPYLTFSVITWLLKTVFSGSVNTQVDGLGRSLFVNPLSPYWYLYCLFFLFLITPTFKNKKIALCILSVVLVLKLMSFFHVSSIYVINSVMSHEIWFVLGMCLCVIDVKTLFEKTRSFCVGIVLEIIFLTGSIIAFVMKYNNGFGMFVLGLVACIATVLLLGFEFKKNVFDKVFVYLSKYTLPIFLMHTIFAATLRSVLFKIGIEDSIVHVILGLVITFVGPIIAANVMRKFKWLEIFLYPSKYIKINKRGNKSIENVSMMNREENK